MSSILCAPYATTSTNSALQNYAVCSIRACGGNTISVNTCGGTATGDTYLRLWDGTVEVAANDDYCSSASQVTYDVPSTNNCRWYSLHQGCFSSTTCSATSSYNVIGAVTSNPTCVSGTTYSVSLTDSASRNYAACELYACPRQTITAQTCGAVLDGDTYLRLFHRDSNEELVSNDDSCSTASKVSYTLSSNSSCGYYTVQQGCFGNSECRASTTFSVTGSSSQSEGDNSGPSVGLIAGPVAVGVCCIGGIVYALFLRRLRQRSRFAVSPVTDVPNRQVPLTTTNSEEWSKQSQYPSAPPLPLSQLYSTYSDAYLQSTSAPPLILSQQYLQNSDAYSKSTSATCVPSPQEDIHYSHSQRNNAEARVESTIQLAPLPYTNLPTTSQYDYGYS